MKPELLVKRIVYHGDLGKSIIVLLEICRKTRSRHGGDFFNGIR